MACQNLFFSPTEEQHSLVADDPMCPGLRNLHLARNDPLIESYEYHMLLNNLGNVSWRPLINLWSVLEHLTKYPAKAGKGSKPMAQLFQDVVDKVFCYEEEDGIHDIWRKVIMFFKSDDWTP